MSNPDYLFLIDENGSPVTGPSLVYGREGQLNLNHLRITSIFLSTEIPGN